MNLDVPQFEGNETCEFSHPSIDGETHTAGSQHSSGLWLCETCSQFMDQLWTLTSEAYKQRSTA